MLRPIDVWRVLKTCVTILMIVAACLGLNKVVDTSDACNVRRTYRREFLASVWSMPGYRSSVQPGVAQIEWPTGRHERRSFPVVMLTQSGVPNAGFVPITAGVGEESQPTAEQANVLFDLVADRSWVAAGVVPVVPVEARGVPASISGFFPPSAVAYFEANTVEMLQDAPTIFSMFLRVRMGLWAGGMFPNVARCVAIPVDTAVDGPPDDNARFWRDASTIVSSSFMLDSCTSTGQQQMVDMSSNQGTSMSIWVASNIYYLITVCVWVSASFHVLTLDFGGAMGRFLPPWSFLLASLAWNAGLTVASLYWWFLGSEGPVPLNNCLIGIASLVTAMAYQWAWYFEFKGFAQGYTSIASGLESKNLMGVLWMSGFTIINPIMMSVLALAASPSITTDVVQLMYASLLISHLLLLSSWTLGSAAVHYDDQDEQKGTGGWIGMVNTLSMPIVVLMIAASFMLMSALILVGVYSVNPLSNSYQRPGSEPVLRTLIAGVALQVVQMLAIMASSCAIIGVRYPRFKQWSDGWAARWDSWAPFLQWDRLYSLLDDAMKLTVVFIFIASPRQGFMPASGCIE